MTNQPTNQPDNPHTVTEHRRILAFFLRKHNLHKLAHEVETSTEKYMYRNVVKAVIEAMAQVHWDSIINFQRAQSAPPVDQPQSQPTTHFFNDHSTNPQTDHSPQSDNQPVKPLTPWSRT